MEKQKHMDINTRSTLQAELDKGTSFKEIGRILGKDCTVTTTPAAHVWSVAPV